MTKRKMTLPVQSGQCLSLSAVCCKAQAVLVVSEPVPEQEGGEGDDDGKEDPIEHLRLHVEVLPLVASAIIYGLPTPKFRGLRLTSGSHAGGRPCSARSLILPHMDAIRPFRAPDGCGSRHARSSAWSSPPAKSRTDTSRRGPSPG